MPEIFEGARQAVFVGPMFDKQQARLVLGQLMTLGECVNLVGAR
ncbi:MAG TPA: hypothetical protein VFS49_05140 [Croceibacterium sp.]|nr:hypothetical protein [Croceibacterium sp.]